MLENIHSVRTYQAVKFEQKMDTFFSTDVTPNRSAVEIRLIDGVGIELKSEKDHVIVPFPNISGIYLRTEFKDAQAKAIADDIAKPALAKTVAKIKNDPQGAKRF
jgi:hypothetical protein